MTCYFFNCLMSLIIFSLGAMSSLNFLEKMVTAKQLDIFDYICIS